MINRLPRQIVLIVILFVANVGIASIVGANIVAKYRTTSTQDLEAIVGILTENNLADETSIIQVLQNKADLSVCDDASSDYDVTVCDYRTHGAAVLAKYGYRPEDFVSQNTEKFVWQFVGLFITLMIIDVLFIVGLRIVDQYHIKRELDQLSKYFEQLIERQDNLLLKNNSENEFSRLKNDLYKAAIVLREAAENNRDSREKLETALEDISHQLRTPLTALQITLDNLYTDEQISPELEKEFLNTARRQVEGMTELVVTLLNLAKFDNKTIKLNSQPVQTSRLLEAAIDKVAILAELQNVEVVTSGDLSAQIVCDLTWQTEAIANIIKNCIEFSPTGEKIEVKVENCPIFTKIIIKDHGPGISKADQKRIFKRFYQVARADNNHVGIGLNFAKTIIEAELGHISVNSEIGHGSEFVISYPK